MGKAKHTRISQRMSQHIIQLKFALRITASKEKPIKPIKMICIYHIQFPLSTLFYSLKWHMMSPDIFSWANVIFILPSPNFLLTKPCK